MGPVDWMAVLVAGVLGGLVLVVLMPGTGRLGAARRDLNWKAVVPAIAVTLIAAVMLGHNFARVGHTALDGKPWLYWMMTGGFALWFVVPALILSLGRQNVGWRARLAEAGAWLAAYLAMGTVFWLAR
ncbi:MAG: DUF1761 domain-containing protein [Novosphingobium sp.]|nr:DUF1761 domain-containing protein [Novosphingobium sp.]